MKGERLKLISYKKLWHNILEILKNILVFLGINISSEKKEREIKLMKAIEQQNISELKRLMDLGININQKYKDGETLLMKAVDKGNADIVKLLLDEYGCRGKLFLGNNKKLDLEIKDKNGETVLMRAIKNGNEDIVELLIINGANTSAKNKNGKTVQEIFLECKSKIKIEDKEKIEDYENIGAILEDSYMLKQEDYTEYVDIKDKFPIKDVKIENKVLSEIEEETEDKNYKGSRENNL